MAAYLIVDTKIHDPEAYEIYKAHAKPMVEKHGGAYLARGGAITTYETDLWSPERLVIIQFPDTATARAFYNDPEYQPVKAVRHGASAATLTIVEGI